MLQILVTQIHKEDRQKFQFQNLKMRLFYFLFLIFYPYLRTFFFCIAFGEERIERKGERGRKREGEVERERKKGGGGRERETLTGCLSMRLD